MAKEFEKESLEKTLAQLTHNLAEYVSRVKAYVQDKSNPLDDRWELFRKVGEVGILPKAYTYDIEDKLQGFSSEISWYDDFYMDYGHRKSAQDLLEAVLDKDVVIEEFQESILDLFVYTIKHND